VLSAKLRPYIFSLLVLIILVGLSIGNDYLNKNIVKADAFLVRWMSAKLWLSEGISPYDDVIEEEVLQFAREGKFISSEQVLNRFFEPVHNLVIYIPFAFIDYDIARVLFMTLIELSIAGIIFVSIKMVNWQLKSSGLLIVLTLLLVWYPSVRSILLADSTPLFIFLLILAVYLSLNNNPTAAGFLLAVIFWTIEFSLIVAIFLIIWQISQKNLSIVWAFISGIVFLLISSLLFFPNWFVDWFRVFLSLYPDLNLIKTPLTIIANIFPDNIRLITIILHLLVLFLIFVEWFGSLGKKGRIITWKAVITLSLAYFINNKFSSVYLLIMLPSLFFILKYLFEKGKLFGKIVSWILLLGLVLGYWIIFRDFGDWSSFEPSLIILGLPLISILGMEWIRWWAVKIPKPIFES